KGDKPPPLPPAHAPPSNPDGPHPPRAPVVRLRPERRGLPFPPASPARLSDGGRLPPVLPARPEEVDLAEYQGAHTLLHLTEGVAPDGVDRQALGLRLAEPLGHLPVLPLQGKDQVRLLEPVGQLGRHPVLPDRPLQAGPADGVGEDAD